MVSATATTTFTAISAATATAGAGAEAGVRAGVQAGARAGAGAGAGVGAGAVADAGTVAGAAVGAGGVGDVIIARSSREAVATLTTAAAVPAASPIEASRSVSGRGRRRSKPALVWRPVASSPSAKPSTSPSLKHGSVWVRVLVRCPW